MHMSFEEVRRLLENNQIEEAIELLKRYYSNNLGRINYLSQIKSDLIRLEKDNIRGIITYEKRTISRNIVVGKLLSLIGLNEYLEESILENIIQELIDEYSGVNKNVKKLNRINWIKGAYYEFREKRLKGTYAPEQQINLISGFFKEVLDLSGGRSKVAFNWRLIIVGILSLKWKDVKPYAYYLSVCITVILLLVSLKSDPPLETATLAIEITLNGEPARDIAVYYGVDGKEETNTKGKLEIEIPKNSNKKTIVRIRKGVIACECTIDHRQVVTVINLISSNGTLVYPKGCRKI